LPLIVPLSEQNEVYAMKYYFALILLLALPAGASQFGNLQPGASYLVLMDGQSQSYETAAGGVVNVNLPAGGHTVALQMVDSVPTPTETPSPTATETESPSPTETPSPTATLQGSEVIVAGFDQSTLKNRFEVIDGNGMSLTGTVEILQGVTTEGQIKTADMNGDGQLEVLAAGYDSTKGVVLEYWSGDGNLLKSLTIFPVDFTEENYLLTGSVDGDATHEVMVVGRDGLGAYHLVTVDFQGARKGDTQILSPGYTRVDDLMAVDTTGGGTSDLAMLARNANNAIELNVIQDHTVTTSVLIFGNGYTGDASIFSLDIDGDGSQEIGAVCRNALSDSFRLLVLSGDGQVKMKRNLFPGKFESHATFSAADIDGDGKDEITAVGRMIGTGSHVIQVIDNDGSQLLARSVLDPSFNSEDSSVMADVNGDGQLDFVVAGKDSVSGTAAYQVLGADGSLMGGGVVFDSPANPVLASSDVDLDGEEEILIMGEFENGVYGLELRKGAEGEVRFSTTFSSAPSYFDAGNLM
jgi:hypothetical protein